MNTVRNIVENYLKAKQELYRLLNDQSHYDVEYSEHEWYYSDGELSWSDDGDEYSEKATFVEGIEGYKLFLVLGCTGEKYLKIVKSSAEI